MQAPQADFSYPTWATATKDMVGTGMDSSRLWFTVAQGIVTEVVHTHPRFTFTLHICLSQKRDVLLLRYRLEGDDNLRPYTLLATRLGAEAENNVATVDELNGRIVLCAEQGPFALALAAGDDEGADTWRRWP